MLDFPVNPGKSNNIVQDEKTLLLEFFHFLISYFSIC